MVLRRGRSIHWIKSSKRAPCDRHNLIVAKEFDQVGLWVSWENLHLVANWSDCAIGEQVCQELDVEVGDSDTFCETFGYKWLHSGPEKVHGDLVLYKAIHWPVYQIKVDIGCVKLGETFTQGFLGVSVLAIPQLCRQKEIFSCHDPILDWIGNRLTNLMLISINWWCVNMAITNTDSLLDNSRISDSKCTQTHSRHWNTACQLEKLWHLILYHLQ